MRLLLTLLLLVLYHFLFWKEQLGLNLVLFSVILISASWFFHRDQKWHKLFWLGVAWVVLSGGAVIVHDSLLARIVHFIACFNLLGWIHQAEIRMVYNSILTTLTNQVLVMIDKVSSAGTQMKQRLGWKPNYALLRISVAPILIFAVFLVIYKLANPVFNKGIDKAINKVLVGLEYLTELISFGWLSFLLLGILVITGGIYKSSDYSFLKAEKGQSDLLVRKRKTTQKFHPRALLREKLSGVITLVSVNLLLLLVNIIDIQWIWFGFEVPEGFSLKQFVHEGTYLLILSILLSIGVLLYYFRANQNFLAGKKTLQWLAYAWIIQNVILAISVGLRNYHYIDFHGLAHRRIGVICFLLLTIAGLLTLWLKIRKVRTGFYLVRVNSLVLVTALVGLSLVNWDVVILRYNLHHHNQNEIDVDNYLSLSPHTLPELYEHLHLVEQQIKAHNGNNVKWIDHLEMDRFIEVLNARRDRYLKAQGQLNWPSWNLADHQTVALLRQQKKGS